MKTLILDGEEAEVVAQALNAYRGIRLAHVNLRDDNPLPDLDPVNADTIERWRTEATIATNVIARLL